MPARSVDPCASLHLFVHTVFHLTRGGSSHASPTTLSYLSTHRGWWLKWVSTIPKHNGTFTLTGLDDNECLSVGRPFQLRHHRWRDYVVGISPSSSAKYGGRHLGLLKSPLKNAPAAEDPSSDPATSDKKKPWMDPLQLCAYHSASPSAVPHTPSPTPTPTPTPNPSHLNAALLDIPAWIEAMHRTKRKRVLAYVVRASATPAPFISLRTGAELTPIMNLRRNSVASPMKGPMKLDKEGTVEEETVAR